MTADLEVLACTPHPVDPDGFNPDCDLPYGLSTRHVQQAMEEFTGFLGFINTQLHTRGIRRFEAMLMPANFSSLVGEFMKSSIPTYCNTLAANTYHNGHPDLLPRGRYPNDAAQHVDEGIEVKGSRYMRRWQGHNAEDVWLMVFVFDSNRPVDESKAVGPKPLRFVKVVGARLAMADWVFSGRSATSRRTITASVTTSGFEKMEGNWIYRDPELADQRQTDEEGLFEFD